MSIIFLSGNFGIFENLRSIFHKDNVMYVMFCMYLYRAKREKKENA